MRDYISNRKEILDWKIDALSKQYDEALVELRSALCCDIIDVLEFVDKKKEYIDNYKQAIKELLSDDKDI